MTGPEQIAAPLAVDTWPALVWQVIQSNPTAASLAPFVLLGVVVALVPSLRTRVAGTARRLTRQKEIDQ